MKTKIVKHSNKAVTINFKNGVSVYADISIPSEGLILETYYRYKKGNRVQQNSVTVG